MDYKKVKFAILQITYWCAFGSFSSFMASYMQSKGMSSSMIGVMLLINTFGGFLGQFFFGRLCDLIHSNKNIFIACSGLIFILEVMIFATGNWSLVILNFGLLGFVQQPLAVNLDTWTLKTYKATPRVYGPIRASGSVGFALFTFVYGGILNRNGYIQMLYFSAFFLLVGIIVALFTVDQAKVDYMRVNENEGNNIEGNDLKRNIIEGNRKIGNRNERNKKAGGVRVLFRDKSYLVLLIMLLGAGIVTAPIMQLISVVIKEVGGTVQHVGYSLFASAMAQVPFMILSGKKHRLSVDGRLTFASCMYFASIMGISMARSPLVVILFCIFNGVGFGVMLPALREKVVQIAPKEFYMTAQGTCDAVYFSLGSMISNGLAGLLIDQYNLKLMLWVSASIQLSTLIIFIVFSRRKSKEIKYFA